MEQITIEYECCNGQVHHVTGTFLGYTLDGLFVWCKCDNQIFIGIPLFTLN